MGLGGYSGVISPVWLQWLLGVHQLDSRSLTLQKVGASIFTKSYVFFAWQS